MLNIICLTLYSGLTDDIFFRKHIKCLLVRPGMSRAASYCCICFCAASCSKIYKFLPVSVNLPSRSRKPWHLATSTGLPQVNWQNKPTSTVFACKKVKVGKIWKSEQNKYLGVFSGLLCPQWWAIYLSRYLLVFWQWWAQLSPTLVKNLLGKR